MAKPAKTLAAVTLAAAWPIALLTPPKATAQERITLESIGAVRMARFGEIRGASPELRPAQAAPARDQAAGHSTTAR